MNKEIVLITGGASGIGAAFARSFLASGAKVLIADRSERSLAAFREQQAARAAQLESVCLDVRDQNALKTWIDGAIAKHRRIDWLLNVAGIGIAGEALEYGPDDWREVIEVNLLGVAHAIWAAYPHMVAQGSGNIVNISSMSGLMPSPFTASYGAAKHGVVGLSRSLRAEARHYGVRVMVVCPGVIDTPILALGEFGRATRPLKPGAARAMMERLMPMNADRFARRTIAEARRNRAIIVVPRWWKIVWWINRLCIPLADFLAGRGFLEMKKQVEANTAQNRPTE